MVPAVPLSFEPSAASSALLQDLLAVSLTAVNVLHPVYDPAGELVDFALDYVNPAGQRMTGLAERPGGTLLTHFPGTMAAGIFAYYRRVYETGAADRHDVNYQADGLDNYFQLAARRSGDLLVVSFSDTADQPRNAVEVALRESQAREQQARAEVERERALLQSVFKQAPVGFALFQGAEHVVALANDRACAMLGHPADQLLGRPLLEGVPELRGQGFGKLLTEVARTGVPFVGTEVPVELQPPQGQLETRYFNFVYQPVYNAAGGLLGIADVAIDVTEQVLARRQLEQLNQELEDRVSERTQALRHAEAEAVAAVQRLRRITESLPSTSFTTDPTGQVHYISPQWYAYTGMVLGAPINEVWPTLIHPNDLPAIAREFGAALAEGRPWGYEFRLRGADGQYRWFASQGVPEPLAEAEAAGRPRQWFGSNLDIDELKQAQQQLEEKDELLTSILSSIPASVVTFEGEDLRYGFFNEAYQQLAQGRVRQGRPAVEVFPEVADQGFLASLRAVLRTGAPYQGQEVPAYARDPHTGQQQDMYLDLAYLPLRHGQHPPHAVLGFIVDVTERVRARQQAEAAQAQLLAAAEQAATQREAFYRVFEQTPACIALLREPDHRFEYVNPAYHALFPDRPLLGRTMAEAFPETAGQGYLARLDRVYQTNETYFGQEVKFTAAPAAGQPPQDAYYDITYQAIREGDQTVGISVFAFDVTERIRARQEREAQRQQLQDLFEQAPVAITVLRGADYVVEVANPLVAELWGRTSAELLGRPVFEALPEVRDQGFRELLDGVRQSGQAFVAEGVPTQLRRGDTLQTVYLNYVYQPLCDADGAITGVAAVATDVTPQVRDRLRVQELNDQLTTANQQLTRTNVDLDNFVYTASHDLRAPISNLDGLLTLLHEELPAEVAQGEYVAPTLVHMRDAVERFKRTIDHLTEVAKLQKEHEPTLAPVDLAAVVEDVRQDLAPLLRATNAQLTVSVANFPAIFFSEKNLRSVVYNLLSNALKYRHPDRRPHVDVQAHVRAGHTVLEVHDNGLGLEPAQVARLFTMFQRFHSHVEGTGIGLFMVKRMVENAGGRIEVHSQPDAGTTFFVHLPHAPGYPAT